MALARRRPNGRARLGADGFVPLGPALEFSDANKEAPADADHTQIAEDVPLEMVAADPESFSCLIECQRDPRHWAPSLKDGGHRAVPAVSRIHSGRSRASYGASRTEPVSGSDDVRRAMAGMYRVCRSFCNPSGWGVGGWIPNERDTRGPIQLDLEARVDRLAFECEHGEGAFVHFAQRRSSDEPFESFDAE